MYRRIDSLIRSHRLTGGHLVKDNAPVQACPAADPRPKPIMDAAPEPLPKYSIEATGKFCRVRVPEVSRGLQPRQILMAARPETELPASYRELMSAVLRCLTTLTIMFPESGSWFKAVKGGGWSERKFQEYFQKLAKLAAVGLGQDQLALAVLGLRELQQEIVARESARIKTGYMRVLGGWAVLFFTITTIVGYLDAKVPFLQAFDRHQDLLTMVTGSFLGTWLSFGIRRPTLGFEDLTRLEDDQTDPPLRLLFVAAMTVVIGLMMRTGVVKVTAGLLDTAALRDATDQAFLIGCICGLAEKALPSALSRRATEIIRMVGGADPPPAQPTSATISAGVAASAPAPAASSSVRPP
jgi:hypothetical protein